MTTKTSSSALDHYFRGSPTLVLLQQTKYGNILYGPITNTDELGEAFLNAFRLTDQYGYYYCIDEERESFVSLEEWRKMRSLLSAARNGDTLSAYHLMVVREDYEYEGWEVKELEGYKD